jgi:hypothetical protein
MLVLIVVGNYTLEDRIGVSDIRITKEGKYVRTFNGRRTNMTQGASISCNKPSLMEIQLKTNRSERAINFNSFHCMFFTNIFRILKRGE